MPSVCCSRPSTACLHTGLRTLGSYGFRACVQPLHTAEQPLCPTNAAGCIPSAPRSRTSRACCSSSVNFAACTGAPAALRNVRQIAVCATCNALQNSSVQSTPGAALSVWRAVVHADQVGQELCGVVLVRARVALLPEVLQRLAGWACRVHGSSARVCGVMGFYVW